MEETYCTEAKGTEKLNAMCGFEFDSGPGGKKNNTAVKANPETTGGIRIKARGLDNSTVFDLI